MAGPSVYFQCEYLFSVDGGDQNLSGSIRNTKFQLAYLCTLCTFKSSVYERYIHVCVCVRAYMFRMC